MPGSPAGRPARRCGSAERVGVRRSVVVDVVTRDARTHWCHFLTAMRPESGDMANTSSARCACCRCCRPTGTGRAPSWPTGWRCRSARCAATSTGCASSATRSRRSRGVDGGYQLAAGAALPPLVLDDDEAVALAVGLQAAAQSGGRRASRRRRCGRWPRSCRCCPPRLRRRVDALRTVDGARDVARGGPAVDPDALTAVAQACRDAERLAFGYTAARRRPRTERLVEPLRLVPLGRRWYLVAYDLAPARLAQLPARPAGRAAEHRARASRPARLPGRRRRGVRPRGHRRPAADRTTSRCWSQAPADDVRRADRPVGHRRGPGAGRCRVRMSPTTSAGRRWRSARWARSSPWSRRPSCASCSGTGAPGSPARRGDGAGRA